MRKIKILVSVLLIYWLVSQYGGSALDSLSRLQSSESILYIILALLFSFSDKLLRIWNFKLVLERSNICIPYPRLVNISFISMFFGFFLPGGAGPDIARIIQLKKYSQGLAKSASATMWVNIATVLAAGVLTFISAQLSLLFDLPFDHQLLKFVILFSLALLVGGGLVLNRWSQRFVRFFVEDVLLKSKSVLHRLAVKFLDVFSSQIGALVLPKAIAISVVVLLLAGIRTYFLSEAIGLNISVIFYLIVLPLILFLTMIPVSFAGIGVREYSFVYFLGTAAVPETDAFLLGLMVTMVNILLSTVGGIVYLYTISTLRLDSAASKNKK